MKGVVGVILAGGLARRMGGGDKGLKEIAGRTILDRLIERAAPQVDGLVLNANGDPARFASFGLPVVADSLDGFAGPLAGVLAGLDWAAANRPEVPWVVSLACDAPFIPTDLVERLRTAVAEEGADMACASSGGRHHPVFGLWPVRLRDELRSAMIDDGMRKVDKWTARYRLAVADWPVEPIDPFYNANALDDLDQAAVLLNQAD